MQGRYEGDAGRRRLVEQLKAQRVIQGSGEIAEALASAGELMFPVAGEVLIEQEAATDEVYFIIAGTVEVEIYGRRLHDRQAGRTVGEMSAINPTIPRSATIRAGSNVVVLRVPEEALARVADEYPELWRRFAADLAERLEQRNSLIRPCNAKPSVFVICSTEALPIAQTIQFAFQHDEAEFTIWSDEVFRASQYPIEALDAVLGESDFAIAIASPEDLVTVRKVNVMQPRDNVLVELGMAIGKLGRRRSMLLVPRGEEVQLPSDFKGLTPIAYQDGDQARLTQLLGPACHQIRTNIREHGVRTDR